MLCRRFGSVARDGRYAAGDRPGDRVSVSLRDRGSPRGRSERARVPKSIPPRTHDRDQSSGVTCRSLCCLAFGGKQIPTKAERDARNPGAESDICHGRVGIDDVAVALERLTCLPEVLRGRTQTKATRHRYAGSPGSVYDLIRDAVGVGVRLRLEDGEYDRGGASRDADSETDPERRHGVRRREEAGVIWFR